MIIQKGKPVRELVYDSLKKLIINGEIAPGEKIIETEYAKKFQISRTPIREAIRMLELEGFVKSRTKGGVTVTKLSAADVEEIYKIRIALEGIILKEVIAKANDEDLKKIDKLLNETKKLVDEKGNEEGVFKLFSDFNRLLYSISDLKRVVGMITNINLYLKRFRMISILSSERKDIAFKEHCHIFEAIKNKDIQKALETNKTHLERSRDFIKTKFEK